MIWTAGPRNWTIPKKTKLETIQTVYNFYCSWRKFISWVIIDSLAQTKAYGHNFLWESVEFPGRLFRSFHFHRCVSSKQTSPLTQLVHNTTHFLINTYVRHLSLSARKIFKSGEIRAFFLSAVLRVVVCVCSFWFGWCQHERTKAHNAITALREAAGGFCLAST